MIELTQGRSVKWQHNGAWFTGYVLESNWGEVELPVFGIGFTTLVRHSSTSSVFIVKATELQDNDFRKAEKLAESGAANELP